MDDSELGKLNEVANKRKERLRQLREKARKNDDPATNILPK